MSRKIELIKIGTILTKNLISYPFNTERQDIYDYYIDILKENYKVEYIQVDNSIFRLFEEDFIIDEEPEIGKAFITAKPWFYTSLVQNILHNCILITLNSIYAIVDESYYREQKLKNLGL